MSQYIYSFGDKKSKRIPDSRNILGGKGANIVFADADGSILITLLEQSLETLDGIELSQSYGSDGLGCYTFPTPGESNADCVCICAIGDANCDGGWNVLDIVLVINYIFGIDTLTEQQLLNADINQDGTLDVLDVVMLVGYILND